ncbi:MAG: hypothetical protein RSD28_03375 [Lachnospiraceae bacterium]
MDNQNIIEELADKYYGLRLLVATGMSQSPEYKKTVLSGQLAKQDKCLDFIGSSEDKVVQMQTSVGEIEAICLKNRGDFELFLQKIAYRCEPVAIPPEIGAMLISGVINWKKIKEHKKQYLLSGQEDWNAEFRKFTTVASNFKDQVLVISNGPYSNVFPKQLGYSKSEWNEISVQIRLYHECTHYICRTKYPQTKDAVRDEVIADCIGLLGAIGKYDEILALEFLGIDIHGNDTGGRLSFYVSSEAIEKEAMRALHLVEKLKDITGQNVCEPFEQLDRIMNRFQ